MFPFERSLDPWIGLGWLAGVFVAAFVVTWFATDVAGVKRTPYVALLSIVTGGLAWGFLTWSKAGATFWTRSWSWAILGAAVASALMLVIARRLPRHARPARFAGLTAWEGVVYGTAEGLLLSVLPVAIMWQVWRSFGWTGTTAASIGGVVAVLASVALIVVHHLGYWEFRGPLMRFPVLFCTVLSVAYLVTANPIAPIVGHIVLHVEMLRRGVELPPHRRPEIAEEQGRVLRAA